MNKKNNKNTSTDNVKLMKNAIKVDCKNVSVKFSRRKSGIGINIKSGNHSYDGVWNKSDVVFKNSEHSHKDGNLWTTSITNKGRDMVKIDFDTRREAREFAQTFKSKLNID